MLDDPIIKTEFLKIWTELISRFSFSQNFEKYLIFIPIFLMGFFLTFILTPIIGKVAKKYDIVYIPNTKRKGKNFDNPEKAIHKGIIPALGGVAVIIPVLLLMILGFNFNSFTFPIFLALVILTIGGILDDVINIPAKVQLIFQVLAVSVIILSTLNLDSFTIFGKAIQMDILEFQPVIGKFKLSLTFPGDLLLFIWLIFCINSFKWVGGSPGLIEGNSLIITFLIFIISVRYQAVYSSSISILLSGSLLALLIFAYPPPLIMSGSSGKSVYGLLISCLSLVSKTKFATTLILLLLPTIDAIYVLIRRFIDYKPKNLSELLKISGTTHFHHQLLKLNMTPRQVFWVEMLITLGTGAVAVTTTGAYRYLFLLLSAILIIFIILFVNFKALNKEKDTNRNKESSESKYSY